MIQYMSDHPALFWLIFSALVSLFHEVIEPRFPMIAKATAIVKSLGLDLPRAHELIHDEFPMLPPMPPAAAAALCLALSTGCASRLDAAIGAVNGLDDVDRVVADEIATKCTPAYREAESIARIAEIDKQCLPLASAYKIGKTADLDLRADIQAYQRGGVPALLAEGIQEAQDAVEFIKRALEGVAQ